MVILMLQKKHHQMVFPLIPTPSVSKWSPGVTLAAKTSKPSPFLANFMEIHEIYRTLRSFVAVCDLETMADLVP